MPSSKFLHCYIPGACAGKRLDQALAKLLPDYSRARLQKWIRSGCIQVDGRAMRPRDRVLGGEIISGTLALEDEVTTKAQAIPLDIRFADADILVINKPAGLVVHPAVGNPDGTLVNALLHRAPELEALPRAGLIHRLDKDTSGLLVVARTLHAHNALVTQLQSRAMEREYVAVVTGVMAAGGRVEACIGRHPVDRKRMAVTVRGKPAITHYRVSERFRVHTRLRVKLETGRTHQIRVHMAHIRYPLLGDPVYGGRLRIPPGTTDAVIEALQCIKRQALHAARLILTHPSSGERLAFQAELPADMAQLIAVLKADTQQD